MLYCALNLLTQTLSHTQTHTHTHAHRHRGYLQASVDVMMCLELTDAHSLLHTQTHADMHAHIDTHTHIIPAGIC